MNESTINQLGLQHVDKLVHINVLQSLQVLFADALIGQILGSDLCGESVQNDHSDAAHFRFSLAVYCHPKGKRLVF